MYLVGFEPTLLSKPELESGALNRSATGTLDIFLFIY